MVVLQLQGHGPLPHIDCQHHWTWAAEMASAAMLINWKKIGWKWNIFRNVHNTKNMFISRPDYKFEGCLYIVGTEIGLIFTLVKIKCVYWNQSVPRWGSKSAVLCGETAQGLMLLFVRGFLQFLVKPPLRVIPPPFEVFLSGHCHLNHYLLINCKLKQFNFVSKATLS